MAGPPAKPQQFATIQERNAYLETVAISYLMNVVLGSVTYDDHKYKCALVIMGFLERQGYRAEEKADKNTTEPTAPYREDPEVLFKQEVDSAQDVGSQAG